MPPIINKDHCTACGMCVDICPMDVFFDSNKKEIPVVSYPEECKHCDSCVIDCPEEAIQLRTPMFMFIPYK